MALVGGEPVASAILMVSRTVEIAAVIESLSTVLVGGKSSSASRMVRAVKWAVGDGFVPLVVTAAHMHPARYRNGIVENPLIYPFATFNAT